MGSLERRVESLEAERKMGEKELIREALGRLSDEELDALEESRRRDRELLERNRALIEAHRRRTKKEATQ
jgi:hypothetical protein